MYTPRSFRVEELSILHTLIQDFNFGILFSQTDGNPVATHLPFMISPDRGENGTLIAHMARANPHWKSWTEETEVLVVFQGPHAYISPAWYEQQETVPTWNYAAVHVYGRPILIHQPDQLRPMVEALVHVQEGHIGCPWETSKMERVIETELKAITGFEIPIDRIEGKFKFNQNRSQEDQAGVVRGLEHSEDPVKRAVSDIMRKNLDG